MPNHSTDRQKLWASALTVLAVALAMGLMLILPHYAEYRSGREALQAFETFRASLDLAQSVSAERGPSNGVMGEPAGDAQPARMRLRESRARSDLHFGQLREAIERAGWRDRDRWLPQLDRMRIQLADVRAQVDGIAARAPEDRDPAAIGEAIDRAFRVVDRLQALVSVSSARLSAAAPATSGDVIMARVLFDAREFGGRLASLAMPSVISRTPLPAEAAAAMQRMRGRLAALQEVMLHSDLADLDADADRGEDWDGLPQAAGSIRALQDGVRLLDRLLDQGAETGRYPLTSRMLTDAYLPALKALEETRETLLLRIDAQLRRERAEAGGVLGGTLAALAAVLAVVGATLWLTLRRILAPLLEAAHELVALAGRQPVPGPRARSEIHLLQDALATLRGRLQERDLLDRQREAGEGPRRREDETDALTGLANRRLLHRIGENLAGNRRARDLAACLVLFDVDRLRAIDGTHGPGAGDAVLRSVAAVAAASVRAGDLLARFGGEGFAVLVFDADEGRAAALAEKVRAALAGADHALPDGARLRVTASFGVASGRRGVPGWIDLIDRADRALYLAKQGGRDRVCTGADLSSGD